MFKLRNLINFLSLNNCSCFVSRNSATSHYRKTKSILKSIEATFRDPLNIIIYFAILVWMSPELTLFLVVFFPIAGIMIGFVAKRLRGNAIKGQSKLGDLISFLEEL